MSQPFKMTHLILEPVTSASVPNNSIFLDSSNLNQLTIKDSTGTLSVVSGGGGSGSNLFVKQMIAGEAFAINKPLSKRSDGKVIAADSDGVSTQRIIGHSLQASGGNNAPVNVLCLGANLAGALTGLGFAPGDEIFLGESGGYTNSVNSFSGDNDSIIKVGIADCAAGVANSAATDLVIFTEVVLRP